MARTDASEWVSIGRDALHGRAGGAVFPTDVSGGSSRLTALRRDKRSPGERRPPTSCVAYLKNLIILGFRDHRRRAGRGTARRAASCPCTRWHPNGGILLRLSTGRLDVYTSAGERVAVADVLTENLPHDVMLERSGSTLRSYPPCAKFVRNVDLERCVSSSTPFRVFCETGCPSWSLTF